MKDILTSMRQHTKYKKVTKHQKVLHIINNIVLTIALICSIDFCLFVNAGMVNKIICGVFTILCISLFRYTKKIKTTV